MNITVPDEHGFSKNDLAFLRRTFSVDQEVYERRCRELGLDGLDSVLDVGCGFGQWSIALSKLNSKVVAVDPSESRITWLQSELERRGVTNVRCSVSDLESLDIPNNSIGGIFCFGAIFLTPWAETIPKLASFLAPGGTIYLNANDIGWYQFLWATSHNQTQDYDPRLTVLGALENSISYDRKGVFLRGRQTVISPLQLAEAVSKCGLEIVSAGPEGSINLLDSSAPGTAFLPRIEGVVGVHEILARKPTEN